MSQQTDGINFGSESTSQIVIGNENAKTLQSIDSTLKRIEEMHNLIKRNIDHK